VRDALGGAGTLLVLGGGSEIGLATARALIARGTRTVVLAARDPGRLAGAAEALRTAGAARVELVPFDADAPEEHPAALDAAWAAAGGDVDIVLLAFGLLGPSGTPERDPAAAVAAVRTNALGGASAALHAAERLGAQGHGTLAVLSSVAAVRARRANFAYGASKMTLDALAQGLGDALHGTGVHVLVVRPGFVRTRMTADLPPAPGATTPERVGEAVAEGIGRGASVVWAPPAMRVLALVLRLLPRPLLRRLPR
jgi:decaprenylphospho-beta-D-erythro-pentofuranosid-2-ulose 2-reductase